MFGEKSDLVYHVFNLADSVSLVFKEVEVVKSFGNYIVDRCAFIERRRRILEYHLDITDDLTVE